MRIPRVRKEANINLCITLREKAFYAYCMKSLDYKNTSFGLREIIQRMYGYAIHPTAGVIMHKWKGELPPPEMFEMPEELLEADYDTACILCVGVTRAEREHYWVLARRENYKSITIFLIDKIRGVTGYKPKC